MMRQLLSALFLPALLVPAMNAMAAYPERSIKLIVPYAAGGGTDTAARMLAQRLTQRLGQTVVVENKPGAATQIGTSYVVRAAPDGYTLLMGTANLATNPALYAHLPYDIQHDLTPVAWVTEVPVYIFSKAGSPIHDVASLLQAAKTQGGMPFATAGLGSIPHLAGEMFKHQSHSALNHIPYKGSAEAVTALLSAQVPISFDNLPPVYSQVKAGKLVPLAIATQKRNPAFPKVPTLTELGYPVEASSWWGVMAPAGTPADIVKELNASIQAVLAEPKVRDYFIEQGMAPVGGPPQAFADHIKAEAAKWQTVVHDADIKLEN